MLGGRVGEGYIHAGSTQLASTITVEETGALELTVRAGTFTWVDGATATLRTDQVIPLTADSTLPKQYNGWLVRLADGTVDVFVRSRLDQDWPAFPAGATAIHCLIWTFTLPPNATDLKTVQIPVLCVVPGFPEGTTAADWYDVPVRGQGRLP